MIFWDLYEIRCSQEALHGVKLRGRVRKFATENDITCIIENAQDVENTVRFAVVAGESPDIIMKFIKGLMPQSITIDSLKNVPNPVLSKLKVNDLTRYELE